MTKRCPWRIERLTGQTPNDFEDAFFPCDGERCPCYQKIADEEWCYREQRRFPLNFQARGYIVTDFGDGSAMLIKREKGNK